MQDHRPSGRELQEGFLNAPSELEKWRNCASYSWNVAEGGKVFHTAGACAPLGARHEPKVNPALGKMKTEVGSYNEGPISFSWSDLANYGSADLSPSAAVRSLEVQQEKFLPTDPPVGLGAVLEKVVLRYPTTSSLYAPVEKALMLAQSGDLSALLELVSRALLDVKMDSGPGYPYMLFHQNNESFVDSSLASIGVMVAERILLLMSKDVWVGPRNQFYVPGSDELTAEDLVVLGWCDPTLVAVKNEPHKVEKISDGIFRLLFGVSLIDQLVERVLFSRQNNQEISMWSDIPSQPGMGFASYHIDAFLDSLELDGLCSSDVSGWDWSVQGWELDSEAWCRARLSCASPLMARCMRNRFQCLKMSVGVFSDGRMMAQHQPGVMPSGTYVTGSSNSRIRTIAAALVGSPFAKCMGDDAVERKVSGAKEKYAALGHRLKDYVEVGPRGQFEYCGHSYDLVARTATPLNQAKQLYGLLSKGVTPERWSSFAMEYAANPAFVSWVETSLSRQGLGPAIFELQTGSVVLESRMATKISKAEKARRKMQSRTDKLQAGRVSGKGDYSYSEPGPVGKAGRLIGQALGGVAATALGAPELASVMSKMGEHVGGLAHYLGKVFGSGDYGMEIQGAPVKNSFTRNTFDGFGTSEGFRVRNVEAITAIQGVSDPFVIHERYKINPMNQVLFPWLSTMAGNFQQYRMDGMMMVYVSESPDAIAAVGSLGYVGWVADYDVYDAPPVSKNDALNRFWSGMTKPSKNYTAFIECAPGTRGLDVLLNWESHTGPVGPVGEYDLGSYYCFGGGQPPGTTEIGQLFVVYDLVFMKPRMTLTTPIPPPIPCPELYSYATMWSLPAGVGEGGPLGGVYWFGNLLEFQSLGPASGAAIGDMGTVIVPSAPSRARYFLVRRILNWSDIGLDALSPTFSFFDDEGLFPPGLTAGPLCLQQGALGNPSPGGAFVDNFTAEVLTSAKGTNVLVEKVYTVAPNPMSTAVIIPACQINMGTVLPFFPPRIGVQVIEIGYMGTFDPPPPALRQQAAPVAPPPAEFEKSVDQLVLKWRTGGHSGYVKV